MMGRRTRACSPSFLGEEGEFFFAALSPRCCGGRRGAASGEEEEEEEEEEEVEEAGESAAVSGRRGIQDAQHEKAERRAWKTVSFTLMCLLES